MSIYAIQLLTGGKVPQDDLPSIRGGNYIPAIRTDVQAPRRARMASVLVENLARLDVPLVQFLNAGTKNGTLTWSKGNV